MQKRRRASQFSSEQQTRLAQAQLFPVKMDKVRETTGLDEKDEIKAGAVESLGEEDTATVAKIARLSKRGFSRALDSMILSLYGIRERGAGRPIAEDFFHAVQSAGRQACSKTGYASHRTKSKYCVASIGGRLTGCHTGQGSGRATRGTKLCLVAFWPAKFS